MVDEKATKKIKARQVNLKKMLYRMKKKSNVDLSSKEKMFYQPESSSSNTGLGRPLDSINISSRFGFRSDPTGYSGNQHDGLDFTGSTGTQFSINSEKLLQQVMDRLLEIM